MPREGVWYAQTNRDRWKAPSAFAAAARRHRLATTFIAFEQALALTREQAVEQCRETIGMPIVQACMGSGRKSFAEQEACVARARPQVRSDRQASGSLIYADAFLI